MGAMSNLIFTALTIAVAVPGSFTVGALGKNVAKLRICELVDASPGRHKKQRI